VTPTAPKPVTTTPKPVTSPKPLPNATAKTPAKVPLPSVVKQTAAKAPQPVKPVYSGPHIDSIPKVANLLGAKYETHPTTGQPMVNGKPVKVTSMKSGEPHGPVTQVAQHAGVPTTHVQKTPTNVTIMPHQTVAQPLLRQGSTGNSVKQLQQMLNAAGAHLKVDGIFGPQTEAAVRQFQQTHHLQVDGIVGPQTWGALNNFHAPAKTASKPTTQAKPTQPQHPTQQPTQQQPQQPTQQPQEPDYGQQIADLQGQYLQQIWQSAPQAPALPQFPMFDAQSVLNQFQPIQPFQWDASQDFVQQYQAQLPAFQQQLMAEDQRINDQMNRRGLYNSGIAQQAIDQQNQALYGKLFDAIQKQSLADQKQAYQEWLGQANLIQKQNQDMANYALNAYKANIDTLYKQGQLDDQQYADAINEWGKLVTATQDAMNNQVKQILQTQQDDASMQRALIPYTMGPTPAQMLPYLYPTQNSLLPYTLGPTPYQQQQLNLDYLKTILPYQMPTAYQAGQLALDQQKLAAQIQQWATQDQLKQEDLNLQSSQLAWKIQYDTMMAQISAANASNNQARTQLTGLHEQLVSLGNYIQNKQASDLANKIDPSTDPDLKDKLKQYNNVMNQISAIVSSLGQSSGSSGYSGGSGPLATPN
jgi:peptidoglycan hydrolase-like protein with peptidoglycan-binding domain